MKLNRTSSRWDRSQRININENWDEIERKYRPLLNLGKEAETILKKALEINAEAQETNNMNESVQQQINTLIAESGTSDAEVLQARIDADGNEYNVLKDRLDESDSQLAQTEKYAVSTVSHDVDKNIIVSFMDDDINPNVWTVLKPIFEAEGVPCSVAAITDRIGKSNGLTVEQLRELQRMGWNVHSHTHTHPRLGDITDPNALEYEIVTAKNILNELGFDGDILTYPFGSKSDLSLQLTRKYHVLGIGAYSDYNMMPIDTYELIRFGIPFTNRGDIEDYKSVVDNAPNNSWIVFYGHVGSDLTEQWKIDDYHALIQHVKSKGYDIVNVREGLERKGNIVDVGGNGQYFKVGRDGTLLQNPFHDLTITNDTPINHFPMGESKQYFNNSQIQTTGFPGGSGGTVTTYRPYSPHSDFDHGSFQIKDNINNNNVFRRRWLRDDSKWDEWELITGNYNFERNNTRSGSDPIQAFPIEKTTVSYFDTRSSGFPISNGLLITTRVYADIWSYQEVQSRNDNRIFRRRWTTSGWTEWDMVHYQSVNPERNAFTSDTPITGFPINQITVFYYDSIGQGDFPAAAGIVTTKRMNQDDWSDQIVSSYYNESTYRRRWRNGAWTDFTQIG